MTFRKYFITVLTCTALTSGILAGCGGSSGSSAPDNGNGDQNDESGNNNSNNGNNNNGGNASGIPAAIDFGVDSTDTGSNPLMYVNGNNNARLTGPVFGTGEFDNSAVSEKLELYGPSGSDTALLVVGAYAGFGKYSSVNTTLFVAIQNVSQLMQCGQILRFNVVLEDGTLFTDSADRKEDFWVNAEGSAYQKTDINGYPGFNDDCIPPGSIVYGNVNVGEGFGDPGPELGQVAGITGGSSFAAPVADGAAEPAAPIVPLSYTVDDAGDISVLIDPRNQIQRQRISTAGQN